MTYKRPNYNYIVTDTIQAAGADLTLSNGKLSYGNPANVICDYLDLIPGKVSITVGAAVAYRAQVLTITAAASTEYGIQVQWVDLRTGELKTRFYYATSLASGSTATTIGDDFRDQINADSTAPFAATGTTTLVLTADQYYAPKFTVKSLGDGTITIAAASPAGSAGVGTLAMLALQGITVTGALYTQIHLEFNADMTPVNKVQTNEPYVLDIYLNEAASNYADLLAKFQYILAGKVSATGPANPEVFALV